MIFLQFASWECEEQGRRDDEDHAPSPHLAGSSIW